MKECKLCPGRVCTDLNFGRLVNDNNGQIPVDRSKIYSVHKKIEECDLRESLETDDERNLLGS